jgi:alpha-1,3-rhamnosyl/mannosyltransferase
VTGDASLQVAVNLLWCRPGRVGGSEEYLARQLLGLHEVAPDEFALTLYAGAEHAAAHPELARIARSVTAPVSVDRRPVRVVVEHTWLARRTRGADVVHHGGGTAPAVGGRPVVLTIHDLQYLEHPEYQSAVKLAYLRRVVPRSVRRADVVTTPSEFVRGTVVEAFGVDPAGVVVVPHGVPTPDPAATEPAVQAAVRRRYGLGDGPFVVYPAITHPHKGHELLVEVFRRHWTDPDLRLVLLGGRGLADPEVEAGIDRAGVRDRVIRPGRVPDADRDALVAAAEALVFPSRYEGFGAPLVEAMALGTPVIAGSHPAVREVVGEAGLCCADDPDDWADALDRVRVERARWVAGGRERAARFDLRASGEALARAYRQAVT